MKVLKNYVIARVCCLEYEKTTPTFIPLSWKSLTEDMEPDLCIRLHILIDHVVVHKLPVYSNPVFAGGSFESFLKSTVKGTQAFKTAVQADLSNGVICIFKSLTCISQPGIIQVLVEVFMECFRKYP